MRMCSKPVSGLRITILQKSPCFLRCVFLVPVDVGLGQWSVAHLYPRCCAMVSFSYGPER